MDGNSFLHLTYRGARRVAVAVIGGTLVLVGMAMIVLPGPAMVVIPAGLGVLALEFAWARRWLRRAKKEAGRAVGQVQAQGGKGGAAISVRGWIAHRLRNYSLPLMRIGRAGNTGRKEIIMIGELIRRTRTIRRYQEDRQVSQEVLKELIDLARFGGSARNCQPLKYMVVADRAGRENIFPHLGWAGYLADWPGPPPGERPAAYIVCLLDRSRLGGAEHEAHFDLGVSTQNIMLGAAARGIFGCRIGSFGQKLASELKIDDRHKVLLVLALGYPAEEVVLEEVGEDGSIRYWRDDAGVHHVPKRSLEDILYPSGTARPGRDT